MNDEQLWKAALGQLELRVSQGNFLAWFRGTKIRERQGGTIIVETINPFTYEWLSKKYHTSILGVLQSLDTTIEAVHFTVQSLTSQPRVLKKSSRIVAHKTRPLATPVPARAPTMVRVGQATTTMVAKTNLNPNYTFDTFVIGPSNEIAHAACRAVADKPGVVYNPLFIYGGVGLGKTHLMQAVGNAVLKTNPATRVVYVSSEKFINEFVQSIGDRTMQQFRKQYREVDVLILDDVQFLAGKNKTKEELFHTFNTLHSQNKQVILSSDRPPSAIPTIEERLSSRLAGGMIADIQAPDYETRLAIVTEKAGTRAIQIDDDALAFIAKNIQRNVRELEGALIKVGAHYDLTHQRITLEYTKKILEGILEQPHPRTVDVAKILEVVRAHYNISLDDLCGKCRKQEIVRPRQIAMYLLRQENNISFPSIGNYFGGRDHTTAMHACEKITKLLERDEELAQEINFIRERLYA